MIITDINNCSRYESLHEKYKELFDYISSHNFLEMPLGRIELCGDRLFINHVEENGVELEKQVLELHETYIDVHMLLEGEETIGWLAKEKIKTYSKEYDKEKDCALTTEKPSTYFTPKPYDIEIGRAHV